MEEGKPEQISNQPFAYLLKPNPEKAIFSFEGLAGIMVTQLSQKQSSSVKMMERCFLVIPEGEVSGEILLTDTHLYFVQHGQIEPPPLYRDFSLPLRISMVLDSISELMERWYQLNDCALELFFEFGVTRLLGNNSDSMYKYRFNTDQKISKTITSIFGFERYIRTPNHSITNTKVPLAQKPYVHTLSK